MEHDCINPNCTWSAIDNKSHDRCPFCGTEIISFFDEPKGNENVNYDN
jgi:hypothetical protein